MSRTLAAVLGGAAGAVALVGIVIIIIRFCFSPRRSVSRTSGTSSSETSVQVGKNVGAGASQGTRHFELAELSLATKNFSDISLIGEGKFGEVYKGLLHDGVFVAIKRRLGAPSQDFIDEVRYLSSVEHRNLVNLLGYCQENGQQFLIYEHIPSGSISSHLYGSAAQVSREKLEFKNRLQIALGAAKGLAHLHTLSPRLVHKNFKTSNVLVDENFIPKVADAGLRHFLGRTDIAGPSSQVTADEIFLAPEVREFRRYSDKSDVYSFGVFLLELLSGQEANTMLSTDSNLSLVEMVQNHQDRGDILTIIDQRLGNKFTTEGMEEFIQLIIRCMDPSSEKRPSMSYVVMELDRILEKETTLTTLVGEGIPTVTLGSQLFETSK